LPKIIQQLEGVAKKLLRRIPQPSLDGATRVESTAAKEPEEPPKEAKDSELVRNLYFDVRALTNVKGGPPEGIKVCLFIFNLTPSQ
jgi:hypothetical protein